MDFLDVQAVQRVLASQASATGTGAISNASSTGDIHQFAQNQLASVVPPDVFVSSATLAKSYFDTVQTAAQSAPKLIVSLYGACAWGLTCFLGWMAHLIGQGTIMSTLDGTENQQSVPIALVMSNIQVIRWSLILGAIFLSLGPFLLLPPIRKILVSRKARPILHMIVSAMQSDRARHLALGLFVLICIFQLFVAYSLVVILTYGPWFRMEVIQSLSVGFCYLMITLFYLYAFWYSMVKREKKEAALKACGDADSLSLLYVLRSSMVIEWQGEKINLLDTQRYLVFYMVMFVLVNCGTLALELYFFIMDLIALGALGRVASGPGAITIVFGLVSLITHGTGAVFLFNEAFRLTEEEISEEKQEQSKVDDAIPEILMSKKSAAIEAKEERITEREREDSNPQLLPASPLDQFAELKPAAKSDVKMEEEEVIIPIERESEEILRVQTKSFSLMPKMPKMPKMKMTAAPAKKAKARKRDSEPAVLQPSRTLPIPPVSLSMSPSAPSLAPSPPPPGAARSASSIIPQVDISPPSPAPVPGVQLPSAFSFGSPSILAPSVPSRGDLPSMGAPNLLVPSRTTASNLGYPSTDTSRSEIHVIPAQSESSMHADDFDAPAQSTVSRVAVSKPLARPAAVQPPFTDRLSLEDIEEVVNWIASEEGLNAVPALFPRPNQFSTPGQFYGAIAPLVKRHAVALLCHLCKWVLTHRLSRDLTDEEALLVALIPLQLNPQTADDYGNPSIFHRFRQLFKSVYPMAAGDMLLWDSAFNDVDDVKRLIEVIAYMINPDKYK